MKRGRIESHNFKSKLETFDTAQWQGNLHENAIVPPPSKESSAPLVLLDFL